MHHEEFRKYLAAVKDGDHIQSVEGGAFFLPGKDTPNTRAVAAALLNLVPALEHKGCSILTATIGPIDPDYAQGCDVVSVRLVIARTEELSALLPEDSQ